MNKRTLIYALACLVQLIALPPLFANEQKEGQATAFLQKGDLYAARNCSEMRLLDKLLKTRKWVVDKHQAGWKLNFSFILNIETIGQEDEEVVSMGEGGHEAKFSASQPATLVELKKRAKATRLQNFMDRVMRLQKAGKVVVRELEHDRVAVAASFRNARLERMNFNDTNFCYVDLSGAKLSGAFFNEARLTYANFRGADLSKATFWHANLEGVTLQHANLEKAVLEGADCSGVDFSGVASLHETAFSNTNLQRANFRGLKILDLTFSGATLTQTNFQNTTLMYVDFAGADVQNANFDEAVVVMNSEADTEQELTKRQLINTHAHLYTRLWPLTDSYSLLSPIRQIGI